MHSLLLHVSTSLSLSPKFLPVFVVLFMQGGEGCGVNTSDAANKYFVH